MSARKWSYYEMAVGKVEVFTNPPKTFPNCVRRYGKQAGKVFRTKRVGDGVEVRRVA